ncbi:MAG: SDR family oxidoreductase [Myxococcota bacterium]|jgi:NAD(P)-dependent dehydrogenase (short-subunit alcohol dehydrogenase family)|nr:SDR family oxidoreductase [Myxococcota bacterium]
MADGLFDLSGKIAIVTGGSRGLGRALCLGLADAGADVVVASRDLKACDDVAREIEATGRRALAVACDMGQTEEVEGLAQRCYEHFGRCDVLVNNAGVTQAPGPLAETGSELFDDLYGINVKGPMHLASQVAPRMAQQGGGTIVNVVTMGALRPGGYLAIYCSSKAALVALTRCMAEEWAPMGVRVNAVAPGPFRTEMLEELERESPGFKEQSAEVTMLKRVAEPEEIVGPVVFLASEAASYVTGQTLSVCGGAI